MFLKLHFKGKSLKIKSKLVLDHVIKGKQISTKERESFCA